MKNNSTEVLFMTGTGFASKQYTQKDIPGNTRNVPQYQQLKDACWSGMLRQMIPEVFFFNDHVEKLSIWQLREGNKFFALEMSEFPVGIDKHLSIDPYLFISVQVFN